MGRYNRRKSGGGEDVSCMPLGAIDGINQAFGGQLVAPFPFVVGIYRIHNIEFLCLLSVLLVSNFERLYCVLGAARRESLAKALFEVAHAVVAGIHLAPPVRQQVASSRLG